MPASVKLNRLSFALYLTLYDFMEEFVNFLNILPKFLVFFFYALILFLDAIFVLRISLRDLKWLRFEVEIESLEFFAEFFLFLH